LEAALGRIAQAFAAANPDPAVINELVQSGASNEEVAKRLGIDDPELEYAFQIVQESAERLNLEFPGSFPGGRSRLRGTDD
jgi:hypothetical protein